MTAPSSHHTTSTEWRQELRSPEQVSLHLPTAGPTSRMLAYALDAVMVGLLMIGLFLLLVLTVPIGDALAESLRKATGDLQGGASEEAARQFVYLVMGLFLVLQLVVELGYFLFWELVSGGRSPGKMALGLRVVGEDGLPVRPGESLVRNLLRVVDALPVSYVVGLLAMVLSADGRRLGDRVAGTLVVRVERPPAAPPIEAVEGAAGTPFRFSHAQLEAVGPAERRLVRQTLRRLESLPPDQAESVCGRSAQALARRIGHRALGPKEHEAFLRALLHAAEQR